MPIRIMAILNVTPDSFSDGGAIACVEDALKAAERAVQAGADILDVGGESTRPGAKTVEPKEEIARVVPVIEAIHQAFPEIPISIDTRKAAVAEAAVQAGASIINDVSGLQYDAILADVAARYETKLVIMHSQGTPETMQKNPVYPNGVVEEVHVFFERQIALAENAGVNREHIILDPGFGFGKTLEHNLTLLKGLEAFQSFALPVLVGTSRKSFLTLGKAEITPDRREALTAASMAMALQKGASVVRVHDVETQAPVIRLLELLLDPSAI